jgi:hypothetical protein
MLGIVRAIQEDKKAVFIELTEPCNFKLNQPIEVKEHKKKRSLSQNALYWAYLTWIISPEGGNLIDQGHFSPDALHEDIKSWIETKYPHQFTARKINRFTTTELNTKEFNEYLAIVDRELMVQFFEINTAKFWGEVEAEKRLPF